MRLLGHVQTNSRSRTDWGCHTKNSSEIHRRTADQSSSESAPMELQATIIMFCYKTGQTAGFLFVKNGPASRSQVRSKNVRRCQTYSMLSVREEPGLSHLPCLPSRKGWMMGWKGLLLLSGGTGKTSCGRGPSMLPACSSEKDRLRPLL